MPAWQTGRRQYSFSLEGNCDAAEAEALPVTVKDDAPEHASRDSSAASVVLAPCLACGQRLTGAGSDQVTLQLGEGSEHVGHGPSARRG